jgi:hypothetical protein
VPIFIRGLLMRTVLCALSVGVTRAIAANAAAAIVIGFSIGVIGAMLTASWVFGND